MENKKTLKRFCYTVSAKKDIEVFLPFISQRVKDKNKAPSLAIQNFECYKHRDLYFVLVDIQSQVDTEDNLVKFLEKERSHFKLPEMEFLNRIFKKDLDKNKVSMNNSNKKRFVMTLELKKDKEFLEAYKEIHKPNKIWPQILSNMDAIGIINMEIYLQGYQAFLIMDTHLDYDIQKDGERWANLPREKEWQQYVSKFQRVNSKNNAMEKWKQMKIINNIK